MKTIAIIPARGGSKRIPHKNIRDFCGQPVIRYSIEAARDSGLFRKVMVSTDDEEIARIAETFGAEVPFLRSRKNSDDFATTEDVIAEVLNGYQKRNQFFDCYGCIYAAAPFVTAEKLRTAFERMILKKGSFLTAVTAYSHPPQRCQIIRGETLKMKWPEYKNTRTQDLEPMYHDCGQFYFGCVDDFFRVGMSGANVIPMVLPAVEVQDIDTEEDWKLAELKYRFLRSQK